MAHKKGVGSTDNGRDSKSKRLGVKLFGGQQAKAGNIIIRQRGTKFHPGQNVYLGKDYTLHAAVDGKVVFQRKRNNRTYVSVLSEDIAVATPPNTEQPVKEKPQPQAPTTEPVAKTEAPTEVKEEKATEQEAQSEQPSTVEEAAPQVEDKVQEEDKPEKPAPKGKTEKIELPSGKKIKPDDLKIVEGIGPKIEGLLNDAGIRTWSDLANADLDKLQNILDEAGPRYRMHNPGTWAKQAELCVKQEWAELEKYQDELKGGKEE